MNTVVLAGVVAAIVSASASLAQPSLPEIRAVGDIARVDIPDLASGSSHWAIIRLQASEGSGKAHLTNAYVDGDTGQLVATGPTTIATDYSGEWQLVHAFSNEGWEVVRGGRYHWRLSDREEMIRAYTASRLYDPFVKGGTVLIRPMVRDGALDAPRSATFLLTEDSRPELIEAVRLWKEGAVGKKEGEWDRLRSELPDNLFVLAGVLKEQLEDAELDEDEVVRTVESRRGQVLAVCAAVIANASEHDAERRVKLLLALARAVPTDQRQQILMGIIGADISGAKCLPALLQSPAKDLLINEGCVGNLPDFVQLWLGKLAENMEAKK